MRLSGAFVSKFLEEWQFSKDIHGARISHGDEHRIVERFMEAMKYEMAQAIIPDLLPNTVLMSPKNNVAGREISLDNK